MWHEEIRIKRKEKMNGKRVAGVKVGRKRRNVIQYRLGKLELRHYLNAGVFVLNRRGTYERVDRKMLRNWIRTGRVVADGDVRDIMVDLIMSGEKMVI